MLNPNERVLRAMAALRYAGVAARTSGAPHINPDFDTLVAWLGRSHSEQSERNDSQRDEVLLRMGQGRAMALAELLKALENAPAMLDRMKGVYGGSTPGVSGGSTPCVYGEEFGIDAGDRIPRIVEGGGGATPGGI
jgi:hypothetical protein